jgi:branched-chain amino acid transport system ATP-binding protein
MSGGLYVENLSKAYGGLAVSRDISLTLVPGARAALIGPNGAGKTTFINLVTGLVAPSAGRIRIGERDVTRTSAAARVRLGLARTFQMSRLFAGMTAREHLGLAILQRQGRARRLFGRLRHMAPVQAEIGRLLAQFGIAEIGDRQAESLAYGERRLLEIAIALALEPKILLLDEPAAGVPQSETWRILAALETLPDDLAVLIVEHDMDLVFRFARRIIVLAEGRVIFSGTPADAAADAAVREAYLGSYAHVRGRA